MTFFSERNYSLRFSPLIFQEKSISTAMWKDLGQGGAQDLSGGELIVSLDIGTSEARVIVAEVTRENIQIVGVGSASSKGTKKGAITGIDQGSMDP